MFSVKRREEQWGNKKKEFVNKNELMKKEMRRVQFACLDWRALSALLRCQRPNSAVRRTESGHKHDVEKVSYVFPSSWRPWPPGGVLYKCTSHRYATTSNLDYRDSQTKQKMKIKGNDFHFKIRCPEGLRRSKASSLITFVCSFFFFLFVRF